MNSLSPAPEFSLSESVAPALREPLWSFLAFAAAALKIDCRLEGGVVELTVDSDKHPGWPKPYRVQIAVASESMAELHRRQLDPAAGLAWIWERAQLDGPALQARPANQPDAVHEFTSRLFEAYQVDHGQVHLAGCHLRDVPYMRLTNLVEEDPTTVRHRLYDAEGEQLSEYLLRELGLADVRPLGDHSPIGSRAEAEVVMKKVGNVAEPYVAATLIGAKWADGTLQFDIGGSFVRLDFAGWTSTLTPPPYHCDASGLDTFHLAAIDDGRIVAAEAIAICEESGRRVLACEMETCSVTGKRVDRGLVSPCPITGDPALVGEFADCVVCRQSTSNKAITDGVCQACREWKRIAKADARVSRLIERYPALAGYHRFRVNETGGVLRLMAVGAWRRWLIVIADGEASPRTVATRRRFSSGWQHLDPSQWDAALGS